MKRVTDIKVLPAKDNFILDGVLSKIGKAARKNKKITAAILAITTLFLLGGCGKNKNNEAGESAKPAATIECPTSEPTVTPEPEATPEPTATIDPEAAEQELAEEQAIEAYQNLLETKTEGYIYPFGYDEVVKHIKISHGNFVGLAERVAGLDPNSLEYELALANYRNVDFLLYLSDYATNISVAATNIKRGDKNQKIVGSKFRNFFKDNDGKDLYGADTLEIMETLAQDVYDAYSADWDTFKAKAEVFQEFVATVFPESRNAWNGKSISSFSYIVQLNNPLGWHLQTVAYTCLGAIFTRAGGEKISATSDPCLTTQFLISDLTESNHAVTKEEATLGCPEGTYVNYYSLMLSTYLNSQMDRYIIEQNEKAENKNSSALIYKP